MKEYKSVLLLKVPFCPYPDASKEDDDFRTRSTFRPWPSLALAALCAFIDRYKTIDYRLKAIDVNIEAYTKPGVSMDTRLYPGLLADSIKNNDYDILAISATFIFNVRWVKMAVELSRKYHPDAKIVIGGGYPTIFPERCLKDYDIDFAIIGEGEATLLHILNKYNRNRDAEFEKKFPFDGYASRDENGKIAIYPKKCDFLDPADLPIPAWDSIDVKKYFKNSGDRTLPIEGSRGCPYTCTYCCTYVSWGRKVRYKPVENLIKEISSIKERYGISNLHFVDDNLSFSKEWFSSFLKKLIGSKMAVKIDVSNFSVKHIDEGLVDLMSEAGMDRILLAVESGSPEIQGRINKKIDFEHLRRIAKKIRSKGLRLQVAWMVGFPGETLEQINETFKLARELRGHNLFSVVRVYPGTKMFEEANSAGLITFNKDDLDEFSYQRCNCVKSGEWDYRKLREAAYDVNIELNFLNDPLLEGPDGGRKTLEFLENLLLKLPDHVMAHIIIGYVKRGGPGEENKHYKTAYELLKNKSLHDTFGKYLLWDHPIINDFNEYLKQEAIR